MGSERVWPALPPAQAAGWACVVCGRDYTLWRPGRRVARVAVGRAKATGAVVFACALGGCQARAVARGYAGSELVMTDAAIIAAGMAFLRAWQAAGDPRYADPDALVTATLVAAAPFLIAPELRFLAEAFESQAESCATTPGAAERYQALVECAIRTRSRAQAMDPAGGRS